MKCNDFSTALVCFDDGATAPQTLVAHYEYGKDSSGATILVATRYTDSAGAPVDTSAGNVSAGACAIAAPDVEWSKLCDVQTNGTVVEFFRRTVTSFDGLGNATVAVTDWALDKTTAYTATGTVAACNEDCDAQKAQGVLTAWG